MDYFNLLEVQQSRQRHQDLIAEAYNESRQVAPLESKDTFLGRVVQLFKGLSNRRAQVEVTPKVTRPA